MILEKLKSGGLKNPGENKKKEIYGKKRLICQVSIKEIRMQQYV